MPALFKVIDDLRIGLRTVDADDREYMRQGRLHQAQSDVLPAGRRDESLENQPDFAMTLVQEYAHALLHFDIDAACEPVKREVEVDTVAYIVGRYVGLDTSGSAFYLATWQDDDADVIQDRLGRIRTTAATIIEVVETRRE